MRRNDVSAHYDQAEQMARQREFVTCKELMKELDVSQPMAKALGEELERKGIVGPSHKGRGRKVLVDSEEQRPSSSPSTPANGRSLALSVNGAVGQSILLQGTSQSVEVDKAIIAAGLALLVDRATQLQEQLRKPQ